MEPIKPVRRKRNNKYFGAFLGIVFPVLGFLLYYLAFFYERMTLEQYWEFLFAEREISGALSLAIILNLPVFFYFLSNNSYETVKGVVGATIFYGVLVIIFKFF